MLYLTKLFFSRSCKSCGKHYVYIPQHIHRHKTKIMNSRDVDHFLQIANTGNAITNVNK